MNKKYNIYRHSKTATLHIIKIKRKNDANITVIYNFTHMD